MMAVTPVIKAIRRLVLLGKVSVVLATSVDWFGMAVRGAAADDGFWEPWVVTVVVVLLTRVTGSQPDSASLSL